MAGNQDIEKMLRAAVDKKNAERLNAERAGMIQTIGRDIVAALTPVLKAIAERPLPIKEVADAIREGVFNGMRGFKMPDQEIRLPTIHVPEVKLPTINVPPPQVHVTVPEIKIPEIKIPDLNNIMGALRISGWDKTLMDHPIPVQLRDADGKPVFLGGGGSSPIFAPSGGGGNFPMRVLDESSNALRVTGSFSISASNASTQVIDSSGDPMGTAANPLNVALVSGSASSTKAQIGNSDGDFSAANPLPVTFSAAASQNVNVSDGQSSTITSHQFNTDFRALDVYIGGSFESTVAQFGSGDNRIKIEPIGGTFTASDGASPNAFQFGVSSQGYGAMIPFAFNGTNYDRFRNSSGEGGGIRIQQATDSVSSVNVVSSVAILVSDVTASVKSALIDSSGVQYSGSNPIPVNLVSQTLASSASALVDSSGVQYSGANPIPVNLVSQSLASSASTIVDSSGVGYSGSNPMPITVVSGAAQTTNAVLTRQANPTAIAADYVPLSADDLGRQLTRPYQVRDLTKTAYVSVTNGTETTFLAGVAGAFLDCLMITGSNNSDAAVSVDIRAGTAGNIVHTMRIPANSTAGWAPSIPWPQDATGNNWTVDGPDETGRTLTFSGLFVQEV